MDSYRGGGGSGRRRQEPRGTESRNPVRPQLQGGLYQGPRTSGSQQRGDSYHGRPGPGPQQRGDPHSGRPGPQQRGGSFSSPHGPDVHGQGGHQERSLQRGGVYPSHPEPGLQKRGGPVPGGPYIRPPGPQQQPGGPYTGPPVPGMHLQHGGPGQGGVPYTSHPGLHVQQVGPYTGHPGKYQQHAAPAQQKQPGGPYPSYPVPTLQQHVWSSRLQQHGVPGLGAPSLQQQPGPGLQHPRLGPPNMSPCPAQGPPFIMHAPPYAAHVSPGYTQGPTFTAHMPTNGMLGPSCFSHGPPVNAGTPCPLPFGPHNGAQNQFVFPNQEYVSTNYADGIGQSRNRGGSYQAYSSCRSPYLSSSRSRSPSSLSRSLSSRSWSPYLAHSKNRSSYAKHSKSRSPDSSRLRSRLPNGGSKQSRTRSPYTSRSSQRQTRRKRNQSPTSSRSRHRSLQRVDRLSSSPVRSAERSQRAAGIKSPSMRSSHSRHRQRTERSTSPAVSSSQHNHIFFGIKIIHFPPHIQDKTVCVNIQRRFQYSENMVSVKIHGAQKDRYAVVLFKRQDDQTKALEANGENFLGQQIAVTTWELPDSHVASCPLNKKTRSNLRPLPKKGKSNCRPMYEKNKLHLRSIVTKDESPLGTMDKTEKLQPKETRMLFINNLDRSITEQDLYNKFQRFGTIVDIYINSLPGLQRFAFLQFASSISVSLAIETMDGALLGNSQIKLSFGAIEPSRCVCVEGLSSNLSNEYLVQRFSEHGTVERVLYNRRRGAALIYYTDENASQRAVEASRSLKITGDTSTIDYANDSFQLHFRHFMGAAAEAI